MSYTPLAQAMIDGEVSFKVYFNPKELAVEKQVQWTQKEGSMSDEPPEEFTKPTPATLSVTLYFDRYESGGNVMGDYDNMMSLANIKDKRPPLFRFVYGNFVFKGVCESLSTKMTMFDSKSGNPVRMEATLKMKRASEATTGQGKK